MITKIVFTVVDLLAILDIIFTLKAVKRIREDHGRWLANALRIAIAAITANMLIAFSAGPVWAKTSYAIYFASIDWIIYFLVGFCLLYTEHSSALKMMAPPAAVIMAVDTLSIVLNLVFNHEFYIFTSVDASGEIFYLTGFYFPYYIHLAVDYIAVGIALFFIIFRIIRSYSMYRIKYVIILAVLLLVVILNIVYMAFGLMLDASVIFYAVAATLIYLSITIFVPRSLLNVAVGHAIDDMNEGLILFDIGKNCIYANAFSKKRFGINESEYGFDREPIASVIAALKSNGWEYGESTYSVGDDDAGPENTHHYRIRYSMLNDQRGREIGSYFLIEDTTEEVYYLNEISEARNNADAANKAKSTFLANMSHEIRTPLNSVLGMNEMILRSTDDPRLIEYAESIKLSGDTLLGLINDILDFSKIEANRMDVINTDYDLHELLRECYYYFEQMAEEKDLYIKITCEESIPSGLNGDEKHIRQVLMNIISNAIKYTRSGGVTIDVSADAPVNDTVDLTFTISDTGIGIAAEDIDLLFDAFRRVNEKENATIQGTGLGLAITKELVSLMNGTISVTSAPSKGSVFTIVLPQKITDAKPIGPFVRQLSVRNNVYEESFHAPDARILVVDDAMLNLKVVEALLRKTQVKIDKASGGAKAIELCRANKYDVILLDHRMPEPDGIETFKVISSEGLNTDTPVIMLTANAISGSEEKYLKMGFAGYLSKPIHGHDLEEAVLRLLPPDLIL